MASKSKKGVSVQAWIAKLTGEVGRGIYVWGGNGQLLDTMTDPEAWITKHETSAENAARAKRLYRLRTGAGIRSIRAFDCSGLMHWALKGMHIVEKDLSAKGLYDRCKPLSGAEELQAGDFVFRHDGTKIVHVGAYIGNGKVIECLGRDDGVTETVLAKRNFNRFGRLEGAFIAAPQEAETQAEGQTLAETAEPNANKTVAAADQTENRTYVCVKGGSVRVRSGGSTAFRTIGIAHAGERYPYLGAAQSGWHRIAIFGTVGYITPNPKYTEVTEYA